MDDTEAPGTRDSVDAILDQWHRERPELPVAPVGIVTRLARVRSYLDTALTEVFAGFDLSPADFQVLVTLRRIGAPYQLGQARLMDALNLTSGTISVRLARLEQRGVVERAPDPEDGRSFTVRLTPQGLDLFDRIAPAHLHGEDLLLSALTPDEQTHLADLLRKLLASFEHTGAGAARRWGTTLEPARIARRRRTAVGLSDRPGLLVTQVDPAGPADVAGLQPGDLLVAHGPHAVRSFADLPDDAPAPVALTVLRGEQQVEVTLRPAPRTAPGSGRAG
jgi:DNA-binding MarR family transcriptional regulator